MKLLQRDEFVNLMLLAKTFWSREKGTYSVYSVADNLARGGGGAPFAFVALIPKPFAYIYSETQNGWWVSAVLQYYTITCWIATNTAKIESASLAGSEQL